MERVLFVLAMMVGSGCTKIAAYRADRLLDRYESLDGMYGHILDGPYKGLETISLERIKVEQQGEKLIFRMRGIRDTGDPKFCHEALVVLYTFSLTPVYVRRDTLRECPDADKCAVLYAAAQRVCIGKDEKGEFQYENLNYILPQLDMIVNGYCLVDHSDTDYPLYKVFRKAEELARKAHRGYWADPAHREQALPPR